MITFLKSCSFPVHTSESDSTTETFKSGDTINANVIHEEKSTVDLQFSDGSYAFNIPKKIFKEGKTENEINYDDADHVPYELPVSEDHNYPTNWEPKAYGSED